MRIAYLILAHNNPNHLQLLIKSLSSDKSSFFIHIDRKSSQDEFSKLNGENIHVCQENIPVYWGGFSIVDATLILLRQALSEKRRFDYFVLLSGTDYPIQPVSYIEKLFENRMPCEAASKPISRLTTYRPFAAYSLLNRIIQKLQVIIGFKRDYKTYLENLVPYGGSEWWALSYEACEYILSFVDNKPRVVDFFKNTVCPDESFFQTILGNSPYKEHTVRNLTFSDWSAGRANPAYLTEKHLDFLTATASVTVDDVYGAGEILFARKFSDETEEITLRLNQLIREKEIRQQIG